MGAKQLADDLATANENYSLLEQSLEQLKSELAKEREKVKELAADLSRVLETVKYLRGIAERGSGDHCPEDVTVEQFVLGYVKELEQALHRLSDTNQDALHEAKARECERLANIYDNYDLSVEAAAHRARKERK